MPAEQEPPRQIDMFSGELVDTRTSHQKQLDRERERPKQQEMFSPREVLQFGVNPHPPYPVPQGTLELIAEDPRTEEEKERDLQLAAEKLTYTLFDGSLEIIDAPQQEAAEVRQGTKTFAPAIRSIVALTVVEQPSRAIVPWQSSLLDLAPALMTQLTEEANIATQEDSQLKAEDSWFEHYFEDRLLKLEPALRRWAQRAFYLEDKLTHDEITQSIRVTLWKNFAASPEDWATKPHEQWLAYAKETYRWKVVEFHRDGNRKLGLVASDMECIANGQDITDDEAVSMVFTDYTYSGQFAYSREIVLADLRIDLERAMARGMNRLCASQRADMPKLISDLLQGYALEETCARYGWTRNRGVTLMRKLRTVFYEELTGEKKTGYLGSHHPLTQAEKQRIRDLYATGLSYRKVGALIGRSTSAVEMVCKPYSSEVAEQVHKLRSEGLSQAEIARRVGHSKTYVGGILTSGLGEQTDCQNASDAASKVEQT